MITLRLPSHFPVRATEWMLATMKVSWGAVLLAPLDVFSNPIMSALAQIASQHVWGWVAVTAGFLHLSALYVNGTRRRSPHLRAACSGIGSLFWFQVCLGMFASGSPTTGWAIYPWLFAFSVYNVVRGMMDARLSDTRAKEGVIGGHA